MFLGTPELPPPLSPLLCTHIQPGRAYRVGEGSILLHCQVMEQNAACLLQPFSMLMSVCRGDGGDVFLWSKPVAPSKSATPLHSDANMENSHYTCKPPTLRHSCTEEPQRVLILRLEMGKNCTISCYSALLTEDNILCLSTPPMPPSKTL